MGNKLVKLIIEQFVSIVDKKAKECHICWDKCDFRIVSRQLIDTLVLQVFRRKCKNKCHNGNFLPEIPLITIEYTNIKICDLDKKKWIEYLERLACEFLNKINHCKNNIIEKKCCICHDTPYHDNVKNCCPQIPIQEFACECSCSESSSESIPKPKPKPCKCESDRIPTPPRRPKRCDSEEFPRPCFNKKHNKKEESDSESSSDFDLDKCRDKCHEKRPKCPKPKKEKKVKCPKKEKKEKKEKKCKKLISVSSDKDEKNDRIEKLKSRYLKNDDNSTSD